MTVKRYYDVRWSTPQARKFESITAYVTIERAAPGALALVHWATCAGLEVAHRDQRRDSRFQTMALCERYS